MRLGRWLIMAALMSVFSIVRGQDDVTVLDQIDFSDTTLIGSEYLNKTIADYVDSNQVYDMILAADNVLAYASSNYEMYKYVYQFLISGFSTLGANMVVDYMVRLPYFEFVDASEEQSAEMNAIAESYVRVRIGAKAPAIKAATIKGKPFDLYEIDTEYTLIMFWSPSCPHCTDMIKDLARFVSKHDNVTLVTVSVDEDLRKVKKTLRKSRMKGYHICDGEGWSSPIASDYAVDTTPSMFLLSDNIIVAKPFDVEELITFFEK